MFRRIALSVLLIPSLAFAKGTCKRPDDGYKQPQTEEELVQAVENIEALNACLDHSQKYVKLFTGAFNILKAEAEINPLDVIRAESEHVEELKRVQKEYWQRFLDWQDKNFGKGYRNYHELLMEKEEKHRKHWFDTQEQIDYHLDLLVDCHKTLATKLKDATGMAGKLVKVSVKDAEYYSRNLKELSPLVARAEREL